MLMKHNGCPFHISAPWKFVFRITQYNPAAKNVKRALALVRSPLFHGLSHKLSLPTVLLKHADWLLPASGGSECWGSFLPSPHAISLCFDCWLIKFGLFHLSCDHAQFRDPLPAIRKGDKGLHLYLCLCSKLIVFSFIPAFFYVLPCHYWLKIIHNY